MTNTIKKRHKWSNQSKHGTCLRYDCSRYKWGLSYKYRLNWRDYNKTPECIDPSDLYYDIDLDDHTPNVSVFTLEEEDQLPF